ncbi:aspartyl-phosphate phosphatase Spo0E family protein [Evansella clarkii]|uniref:aspartyl-phosphate phosphatase Spo0E family protein n=1 Tax=Evansella clarkii TaxID=79879 RepID=UPI000B4465CA|nr:aspartyl-phosphate phosphatase Spo0E family protein [Evansella clarkii]
MNSKKQTIQELENKITVLKEKMITTGIKKGLSHDETVQYSQELDGVINTYNELFFNGD